MCSYSSLKLFKTNLSAIRLLSTTLTASTSKEKCRMSAWQIHSYGGFDELMFSDKLKIPQIRKSNECLIRVCATTVNPIDVAMMGGYGSKVFNTLRCQSTAIEFPLTLGREFCGIVEQKGMGSRTNFSCGDRVWGVVPLHKTGCHAEYVVVPDYCITKSPNVLSDEAASAVLYAGLTVWSSLYLTGNLGDICGAITSSGGGSGKKILVLGGSGGTGTLAIQILKSQNVTVYTTCSEDAIPNVQQLGADYVIDYSKPDNMEILRSSSPFDIVLDCAGQGSKYAIDSNFTFNQYITLTSPMIRNTDSSGLLFGMLENMVDLVDLNVKSIRTKKGCVKWGIFVPAPQGIEFLRDLCESKKVRPIIDSTFKFDQLPEAFRKVKNGHLRGKVVIKLS